MELAQTPRARDLIAQLDLTGVEKSLRLKDGFAPQRARQAVRLYRQFLTLVAENPGKPICPPGDADAAWHYHILDTRSYARDCQAIFGYFVHHDPYAYGSKEFDESWAYTKDAFAQEFDVALAEAKTEGQSPYDAINLSDDGADDGRPASTDAQATAPANCVAAPEFCFTPGKAEVKTDTSLCVVPPEFCFTPGKADVKTESEQARQVHAAA